MSRIPQTGSILNYNLFGERGDLPDVAHCETISARSVLHDWEFASHRHPRLFQILLIASGGGEAQLEDGSHALHPLDFVFVPALHVHGFRFEPGTQGWVLTLASDLLDEILTPEEGLPLVLDNAAIGQSPPQLVETMREIEEEFEGRKFGRAHMLRALCSAAVGMVARLLSDRRDRDRVRAGPGLELLQQFQLLLERHYAEQWSVSDYARSLGVTPTHLSRLARAVHGRPASGMIADRLVREARRNLAYTSLPVGVIAYSLGFHDPAYFTRIFTRATGLSPSAFRTRAQSGADPSTATF